MTQDIVKLDEEYRTGDTQYRMIGGEAGCHRLANDFYDVMEKLPQARKILFMHPSDLTESREKLGLFLCDYLNGPPKYEEKYGPVRLGQSHGHLAITSADRDAWLLCMEKALEMKDVPQAFRDFMMKRFAVPAERVRNRP
ncbi:group II truncated hemoglobin [Pontiella sp.]|uniref:group II truncated hemoglobin n=1 Tax=Pontiella sp. TaxID=2837462 RepID=UPI00356697DC